MDALTRLAGRLQYAGDRSEDDARASSLLVLAAAEVSSRFPRPRTTGASPASHRLLVECQSYYCGTSRIREHWRNLTSPVRIHADRLSVRLQERDG